MTSRSGRGRWELVEAARRQERLALGRDQNSGDDYGGRPKPPTPLPPPPGPTWVPSGPGVRVLTIGEAAARLGMSRSELEALIDRGAVKALPTGFTRMIPTSEVERLRRLRS
jgi:excisionase family DNA binding protein